MVTLRKDAFAWTLEKLGSWNTNQLPFFEAMNQNLYAQFKARMAAAQRGRPKTALPEVRHNGYKDENGRDVLSDGLKPWHERVVDYMILNPHAKIVDIAKDFQVTPQWMGRLIKTDAFVEYYQSRMGEHRDVLHTTVIHKMQGVAIKSLDKIAAKIDSPEVTFGQAKEAAELTLKGLGYTNNNSNQNVSVNVKGKNGETFSLHVGTNIVDEARKRIQERAKSNVAVEHDKDNYSYVTAAMELPTEAIDAEYARDVTPDDES